MTRYSARAPLAVLVALGSSLGCSPSPSASSPLSNYVASAPDGGAARDAGDAAAREADASVATDGASARVDGDAVGDARPLGADADEDANADGAAADTDAGASPDGGADAAPGTVTLPGPVCSPSAAWTADAPLAVMTQASARLGAITPDELTIAWTFDAGASTGVAWADRASSSDAFGAAQIASAGAIADDRVALSPDGLRLVVVDADRQGFSELTRAARSGAGAVFGSPAAGAYVNFDAPGALGAGQSIGDPVLNASDTVFYYSLYGGGASATIQRAERLLPTDPWPLGAPLPATSALLAVGSARRRPTAISSDQQTLFFWDEESGLQRAAWIDVTTGVFDTFADVGAYPDAVPNAPCTRLYHSAAVPDGGRAGIGVVAP